MLNSCELKKTYVLNPLAPEFVPRAKSERDLAVEIEPVDEAAEFEAMPVEVLVKIFNFLPNQDIRCGISLACTKFYKICQDESLVPVKDLCIHGRPLGPKSKKSGKQSYSLRNNDVFKVVSDTITQSKNLTSLKFKALNSNTVNDLLSIALQACPKLTHLEFIETSKQSSEYFEFLKLHL